LTIRTNQSRRTRDEAIVECLRIFAREGRRIRMQQMSLEKELTSESKDASTEQETVPACTSDET
jgi:hypothetical protein